MTLQEIFDQLQTGELSQLAIGELDTLDRQKTVVNHINLGLTELHKRFWIKRKELLVQVQPGVTDYLLKCHFAKSNVFSSAPTKYIVDSEYAEFKDDLFKVEQVYNELGDQLPLNDYSRHDSLYTPWYNVLRIPLTYPHQYVLVEYRANTEKIVLKEEDNDPCEIEVELPPHFLEPLVLFVGHRAFRSLNTDQKQESTDYKLLYEEACKRIEDLDYNLIPQSTNTRLDMNGWV